MMNTYFVPVQSALEQTIDETLTAAYGDEELATEITDVMLQYWTANDAYHRTFGCLCAELGSLVASCLEPNTFRVEGEVNLWGIKYWVGVKIENEYRENGHDRPACAYLYTNTEFSDTPWDKTEHIITDERQVYSILADYVHSSLVC